MEAVGINVGYLLIQLFVLLLVLASLGFSIYVLLMIWKQPMDQMARLAWTLAILVTGPIGALLYLVVSGRSQPAARQDR